jgi:hypothetical protein
MAGDVSNIDQILRQAIEREPTLEEAKQQAANARAEYPVGTMEEELAWHSDQAELEAIMTHPDYDEPALVPLRYEAMSEWKPTVPDKWSSAGATQERRIVNPLKGFDLRQ